MKSGSDVNTALYTVAGCPQELPACAGEIRPLAEVERAYIETAIALCDGNIPRAALLLRVSPSTIYRKKAAWDAVPPPVDSFSRRG